MLSKLQIRSCNHLFILTIFLLSNSIQAQGIFQGDSLSLGDGTVYTWVQIDGQGVPEAIGVTLTETVFSNLPSAAGLFSLDLPDVASDSLFIHILFDWNPQGHPPNNIYGLPHFDFHFFIITDEERTAIPQGVDTFTVAAEYIPQDYRSIDDPPFSVSGMGVHWIDSLSSEWQGETFTETVIYGFYQGDMVFVEPMITLDYLQSNPNVTLKVKQPQSYQKEGYYPTNYSIEYDAAEQEYNIFIKDFVFSGAATTVEEELNNPKEFYLTQNYPNPFNPTTIVQYAVSSRQFVTLKVYDVLGNELATLVNEEKPIGSYEVEFNATGLPSGIYFYRLKAGSFFETKKMVLMK